MNYKYIKTTIVICFVSVIILLLSCNTSNNINKTQNVNNNEVITKTPQNVTVVTTAKDTELRLSVTDRLKFEKASQAMESETSVFVNPSKSFQEIVGVGGSITDASSVVFAKLSDEKQKELLDAYFSPEGLNYSLLRTTIHSCDFSPASYTYIEYGDKELKTFSVKKDMEYRIPLIKKAMETHGSNMFLFASPWSPPAFMKDNNSLLHGGKLLPEFYQPWANYYVKFINAYKAQGINFDGITIQNEPMAKQRWESCIYTAEEERDFLKNYLGPTLHKSGMKDLKVIVWDHNRDLIVQRANTILEDKEAAKYVWGIGFHWYETWRGAEPLFKNLNVVNEEFPDKKLFFTEGCNERFVLDKLEYWANAERYGRSIIEDFNSGTVAWTDWNILLDMTGGPNHVGNLCFAPVHADTEKNILYFTPAFYYLGHFSKYINPGAKRLSTSTSYSRLLSTSFVNKDNKISTIVMNTSTQEIKYNLYWGNDLKVAVSIPARAIQTLVY